MILSVSSRRIGIKRSAIDIIIAISCTGTLMSLSGFITASIALVRRVGVVVSVIRFDPRISRIRRAAMKKDCRRPSRVTCNFQNVQITSPFTRNIFITIVKTRKNMIGFSPFTI